MWTEAPVEITDVMWGAGLGSTPLPLRLMCTVSTYILLYLFGVSYYTFLVCSITEPFYEFCRILTRPKGTKTSNKLFIIQVLYFMRIS